MVDNMEVCCRNCGGKVVFIPERNKCYCEYCRKESNIGDLRINHNLKSNRNVCTDCGAELITEKNTLITKCAYCGSHQIIATPFNGKFQPDLIIPFNYGINSFLEKLKNFAEYKEFSPNDFIDKIEIQDLKGIYIPFRKSELYVKNDIRGELVCEQSDEKFEYHKPTYFECNCEYNGEIVYDVSKNVENLDAKSIGPFDLTEAVKFTPAYLCNFSAQPGDDDIDEVMSSEIAAETKRVLNNRLPNFTFNAGTIDTNYAIKNEENILVPIWYFDFKYKKESYSCIMNGQTGKVIGNMPISKMKLWKKTENDSTPLAISFFGMFAIYQLTFNIYAGLAAFLFFEIVMHLDLKGVAKSYASRNSNYSSRNLNSKATVKKYIYNYINTYDEYHEKYKDDKLDDLTMTVSDGEKITYQNKKDKVYDIKK